MHSNSLDIDSTLLVVVDVQEAFRKAIPDFAETVSRIAIAIRGFQLLGRPVVVTEQYPKGLGRTAEELLLSLPDDTSFVEKSAFSSYAEPNFVAELEKFQAKQIVLCGVETHVCVNQTAHDLLAAGYQVHLLTDCVASRYQHDREAGLKKMFTSGVVASSMEMALFEMMRDSRQAKFRDVQALIK
ncbi:MAG: isochorismatase family protein [bacterium]|nr:isochorismatase family protein [bacterium]